ncbi:MAG: anaerobic ribonucleoside-triphosphate reductase activating protein [Candidatus Glassbacteria bacterium RIFCSPLOWO2_12_FULL_58_11]|uniref:Anaerobic ribonucleoside-triphosphate reductase activating protein n=2 Tax=Candidatus Glassiibacteriota TaxID=1817805 RepID=A0A1F5YZ74_9BACT|nr:MAG: anaerobic ribonucleoside-triphosphate reductase activating protein [Candidatus Glassbacteria bacterium GWA2_58_10]OGG05202.1 MAG: anaerobic ribonucleoside-triphosphate reductase activating protein [Candidatus Glassbacteria bacterium RIFCSPLOWO2_12_FULL_58_11]
MFRGELSPVYAMLKRPSLIDYPGKLCRVLFISGCNMHCLFCHNSDLTRPKDSFYDWPRLLEALTASREYWVDSVCISGGEPTLHPKIQELIQRIKEYGFHVKLDTNGTRPKVLKELLPLLDYVAMDYKAPLARYGEISGCPALDIGSIPESAGLIAGSGCEYEFRTTVVQGFHGEADILAICRELSEAGARRYALQAFVPPPDADPESGMPTSRTPMKTLEKYHQICRQFFEDAIVRGA